jgi:hypothetical protein
MTPGADENLWQRAIKRASCKSVFPAGFHQFIPGNQVAKASQPVLIRIKSGGYLDILKSILEN